MTISNQPLPEAPSSPRSWWLAGLALVLSLGAFFLPQRIPLEWYPLNEPGDDINYLQIKCATDRGDWIKVFYDRTHGFNELDSIQFPISATKETYTYTFPLPDAPIVGLRLAPVSHGGTLTVDHLRIINRRGDVIRRFPVEALVRAKNIQSIESHGDGWKLTSEKDKVSVAVEIELHSPIIPVGMNHRNLLRCLLSTGYLALMLSILILAVVLAFWRPSGWRDLGRRVGMVVALAIPLAAVGNRGLIRNSIDSARFVSPPPQLSLELELRADRAIASQLFWDVGHGFRERDSARRDREPARDSQTIRFPLPSPPIRALRFDPHHFACVLRISAIRLVEGGYHSRLTISLDSLQAARAIDSTTIEGDELVITTTPDARDPILFFTDSAVQILNQAME